MSLSVVPPSTSSSTQARRRSAPPAPITGISKRAGVVEQVRIACAKQHRLATGIGALIGALVPVATYMICHRELTPMILAARWQDPRLYIYAVLVLGGLVYSATTVYEWGRLALTRPYKALGFTVLAEGVMTCSEQTWLGIVVLAYLVAINAIATGVTLARGTPVAAPAAKKVAS